MVQICSTAFDILALFPAMLSSLLFVNAMLTLCQILYKTAIKAQHAYKISSVCTQ